MSVPFPLSALINNLAGRRLHSCLLRHTGSNVFPPPGTEQSQRDLGQGVESSHDAAAEKEAEIAANVGDDVTQTELPHLLHQLKTMIMRY